MPCKNRHSNGRRLSKLTTKLTREGPRSGDESGAALGYVKEVDVKKDIEVPEELKDLMLDYTVNLSCRDRCIVSVFKAKRAIFYGKQAEKARIKFWKLAAELFPQTKKGTWHWIFDDEILREAKKDT